MPSASVSNATASYLTRAGVLRMDATVKVAEDRHPWDLEADAGDLELPEPSPRPSNIVNVADVEGGRAHGAGWGGRRVRADRPELGIATRARRARPSTAIPRTRRSTSCSRRRHARPRALAPDGAGGTAEEEIAIRAGHVISRPPGTGIAQGLRAGDEGITFLAYGTRKPGDICYYPRSNKIYFRGLGLIARLEDLDYDDGEPG